jgi:hypothetical protein
MASAMAPFAYHVLHSEEADSFRLLSLLPGADDAPIECTLRHANRSDRNEPYEALSYMGRSDLEQRNHPEWLYISNHVQSRTGASKFERGERGLSSHAFRVGIDRLNNLLIIIALNNR